MFEASSNRLFLTIGLARVHLLARLLDLLQDLIVAQARLRLNHGGLAIKVHIEGLHTYDRE